YRVLLDEFQTDKSKKVASIEVSEEKRKEKEAIRQELEKEIEEKRKTVEKEEVIRAKQTIQTPKTVGKIDLEANKSFRQKGESKKDPETKEVEQKKTEEKSEVTKPDTVEPEVTKPEAKKEETAKEEAPKEVKEKPKEVVEEPEVEITPENSERLQTKYKKLTGPTMTGERIDLNQFKKPKKKKEEPKKTTKPSSTESAADRKKKRRRITKDAPKKSASEQGGTGTGTSGTGSRFADRNKGKGRKGAGASRTVTPKAELTDEEVQKQVRETLEKLQGKSSKSKGAKYRREKRDTHRQQTEKDLAQQELESKVLKVTEFVTASEVATMMDVSVTQIISACMSLGMMVTMNQRLDAETLSIVADEFGYEVEFITADIEDSVAEEADKEEDLQPR